MLEKGINWGHVARLMVRSRELDQLEVQQLTPQGKVKYQFSAGGHELAQILLALALDKPHDAASVYYRSRPFLMGSGLTLKEALQAGMAKRGGTSEGRDVGVMFNLPGRTGATVLPTSGDEGAQYTPAAGWAQAIVYRRQTLGEKDWEGCIATALGGDGSVASNGFWAALNMVTTLKLPMLFFIEDNQYGLSVPAGLQTPGGNISANLASFKDLKVLEGDGTQPQEAWQVIQEAVGTVRSEQRPCLLRMSVPRLSGHTFIDDQSYKSQAQLYEENRRDPLVRLREFLRKQENIDLDWDMLLQEVKAELANALQSVENSREPDPANVRKYLFFEGQPPQQGGLRPEGALKAMGSPTPEPAGARINLVDAVRRTMEVELALNPRMLVFGEDVGVKGGVHGATLDMQRHFGAERVFDTSLSEEAIIGRATGIALAGLLPVPEIQFRKYADPAHEQISDLGTIRWRTANHFAAPLVLRMPVGFGKVTGDPWHSVSGEAVFAHLPGWKIAYPSNAEDAVGLLRTALRGDDPTLFLEHRALLDTHQGRRPYPGDDYCLPFGKAATLSEGDELTVITWGAMVSRCLAAAHDFAGRVAVLDLRTIVPWDQELMLDSVKQTGKVLVVQEDTLTTGFAGEIIATIAAQAFTDLDAPVKRMGVLDVPIPYNQGLMEAVLPSEADIRREIAGLLAY